MSFSRYDGAKHQQLGYCNVVEQEPNQAGQIQVKTEADGSTHWVHPTELERQPTDMNHRIIKIGDLILYTVKSYGKPIQQGRVETIKQGKSPRGYRSNITRIGIREDLSGYVKSVPDPDHCLVIDVPLVKKFEDEDDY